MDTLLFVTEILGIVALICLCAWLTEKALARRKKIETETFTTQKITAIGIFSAISAIFMMFDFALPLIPSFYKMDISDMPALILSFAYGPVAGVLTEMLKVFLKALIKGTSTAFVGEIANFVIGCSFVLPAGIIYLLRKNKQQAVLACVAGTLIMTVFGSFFNAVYLLPKFAELYGMPLDAIVKMGTAVNPAVHSVGSLVLMAVVPLNLLKGALISVVTMLIYKRLSPILKKA